MASMPLIPSVLMRYPYNGIRIVGGTDIINSLSMVSSFLSLRLMLFNNNTSAILRGRTLCTSILPRHILLRLKTMLITNRERLMMNVTRRSVRIKPGMVPPACMVRRLWGMIAIRSVGRKVVAVSAASITRRRSGPMFTRGMRGSIVMRIAPKALVTTVPSLWSHLALL